jgi:DNA-binding response OmpR family regulator
MALVRVSLRVAQCLAMQIDAPPRRIALDGDEPAALAHWRDALAAEGFEPCTPARTPGPPDALLLLSGNGAAPASLRTLRAQWPATPLLLVLPRLRDIDQVLALELGADDVLDAAWAPAVAAARLRALWRRMCAPATPHGASSLRFGALRLDAVERTVHRQGHAVTLTESEFELLWLLARHAGRAVSRREIARQMRGRDDTPPDRAVDSHVYRLRAKLGDTDRARPHIRTVRHCGYLFSPAPW